MGVQQAASGWRVAVVATAATTAVAALGGALSLAVGWIDIGEELTGRLPFASPALAGVALALLVGVPHLLLTVLAVARDPRTAAASVVVGATLVGWIVVEVAFIRVVAPLQVFYVAVGLAQVCLGFGLARHDPGVAPGTLWRMIRDVLSDVPVFLTAPLYRRHHLHWGASDAEVAAEMPGDELVPDAAYRATRAITIDAPPEVVWAWLVQVGADRAGWYSDDLIDHRGEPSAHEIVPTWQDPLPGDLVRMSCRVPPPEGSYLRIYSFEHAHWLLWTKSDATWSWLLEPAQFGGTRLVTRVRARYDWQHTGDALVSVVLMELGDFAMMRRMLRGIRDRAGDPEGQLTR